MYLHPNQAHSNTAARLLGILKWLGRSLLYLGAFSLPIILIGGIGLNASLQSTLAVAPAARRDAVVPQPAPRYDHRKPTVAIVLGDLNDANDVLGPYALFAESAAYNVYTVADTRDLRTLTGGLDIMPHYSFAELESLLGHSPDVVVVPAMPKILAPQNQPVLAWLRRQATQPTVLFSWCTGAEVLAASGVLDGKAATTHWGDIDRLERSYPAVRWQRGVRYVEQGQVVTSAGLTSGIDATLHLLARWQGQDLAERVAHSIHYSALQFVEHPQMQQYQIAPADSVALLTGAFAWPKQHEGLWLYDRVSELDLAAVFEVYNATWAYQVDTLAAAPTITSQHGLQLIPRWQAPDLPTVDRVLVPGGPDAARAATLAAARAGAPVTLLGDPAAPRFAYEVALEDLARQQNVPLARFAAKRLEYRADTLHLSGAGWPFQVIALPLLIGSLGVAGAFWLLSRARRDARGIRRIGTLQRV